MGQVRLMDEMEKLKEKMNQEMKELKEELEDKLSGHKDMVRAEGEEPAGSSSKLLHPTTETGNYRGIGYREEKGHGCHKGYPGKWGYGREVGMTMKELGFSKQYTVMGRIGGLRKRGGGGGLRRVILQTLVEID